MAKGKKVKNVVAEVPSESVSDESSENEENVNNTATAPSANQKRQNKFMLMDSEDDSSDDTYESSDDEERLKNNTSKVKNAKNRGQGFKALVEEVDSSSSSDSDTSTVNDDSAKEKVVQKSVKKDTKKVTQDVPLLISINKQSNLKKGKKRSEQGKSGNNNKKSVKNEEDDLDAFLDEIAMKHQKDDPLTQNESKLDKKDGQTLSSAAQKRKEKKERQKKRQEGGNTDSIAVVDTGGMGNAGVCEKDDTATIQEVTSNKTKNKKAKGKEEKVVGGKKPGGSTLKAMQDALKQLQLEEEQRKKEEEERLLAEERAEEERLEKLRLEDERKLAKKAREKEKKEQLKKDGKLLTAKQKAERARVEASLQALRAQGVQVPDADGTTAESKTKKLGTRVRYGGKNNNKSKPWTSLQQTSDQNNVSTISENCKEEIIEVVKELSNGNVDIIEKGKKTEDDVLDTWDTEIEENELENDKFHEEWNEKITTEKEIVEENVRITFNDEMIDLDKEERAIQRIVKRRGDNEQKRNVDKLRSPVICVLGHVDTGKTKILDKLRRTNVQDGEAGGITQQIGATNVPIDVIYEQCKMVNELGKINLPGLLIIDTPGHESFSNLRDRGSSLCDIAILVVDIMHGLEPQTIESINLLKKKKTPFAIALNKVDRLYEWKGNRHKDIRDVLKQQSSIAKLEFDKRAKEVITAMAEQGLNAALFHENPDPKTYISMVPTSAHSGDGMGNLMALLVHLSQSMLTKRLSLSDELQATILEVKAISGLGTTIDIILVNGHLKEGDTMILASTDGPILTQIKALLTPSKMQDLRVKNTYIEHKSLSAAQGVKIAAKDLENAIAGTNILVANHPDEISVCKTEIQAALQSTLSSIKVKERGVFVQASTLGSLEALLDFLTSSKIPYAGVKIGPVVKRDVMKASVMLEHEEKYTVILAFDVKVERDAQEMADSMGVTIFQADIIYHLFDAFTKYQSDLKNRDREANKHMAVFPCKCRILPTCIFNSRDPIVMGVVIEAGVVKQGTPLCVPSKNFVEIGIVTGIEGNHKSVESARKGQEVCLKIEPLPGDAPKMFGRHFDETDMLISKISRDTIEVCKKYFREDLDKTEWRLMAELKNVFQIL